MRLGLISLVPDSFWSAMCVAMISSPTVGTAMTLIVGPTLYATLYRVSVDKPQPNARSGHAAEATASGE